MNRTPAALETLETRTLLSASGPTHFLIAEGGEGAWFPIFGSGGSAQNAPIVNGGFEEAIGLKGWNTTGNTATVISNYYTPPEGVAQASISNGSFGPGVTGPSTAADLETFLGVKKGSLVKRGVVNGSAIRQTFKSSSMELLTFKINFLTNEDGKSDFGFITLNNGHETQLYKLNDGLHLSTGGTLLTTNMVRETGYGTYTVLIPRGGTYTIGFGVTNVGNPFGLSTVIVDNVQLTPLFMLPVKNLFPDLNPEKD